MNKWLELLIGLILILVPLFIAIKNYAGFGDATLDFIKGGVIIALILAGLLFVMIGISDLKE
jgi:hypothetical protein